MNTTLDFSTVKEIASEIKTDVLFVNLFVDEDEKGSQSKKGKESRKAVFDTALNEIDQTVNGKLSTFNDKGHFPTKAGDYRTFYDLDGVKAEAIVIISTSSTQKGLGKSAEIAASFITKHKITSAAFAKNMISTNSVESELGAMVLAKNLVSSVYTCEEYKSAEAKKLKTQVAVIVNEANKESVKQGIKEGQAIGQGMNTYKDLGNAPGNVCTPKYLAKYVKQLAEKSDTIEVCVLKEFGIEELGMGALLSVSKGSSEKPRVITMEYKGGEGNPVVLIGKGVTFDTGGISLKGSEGMEGMKYDMCGAATVVGVIQAVAEMQVPINLVGIIPAVENMPSSRASKPGDIVTSLSGKTIEVINTDAEGRMILCDSITYSARFNPKCVIDIATLTGAAIVALGSPFTALMSYDDDLANSLIKAGEQSNDPAWRLPLNDEYVDMIKSDFADLRNVGKKRQAGTITAGAFLGEFAKDKDLSWAHLDIAATAEIMSSKPSGRPVPLLVQYLKNCSE